MPSFFLRISLRAFLSIVVISSPSINTLPPVGSISLFRQRMRVDFPLPESPITTNVSPSSTEKLTLLIPIACFVLVRISSLDFPSSRYFRAFSGWSPNILNSFSMTTLGKLYHHLFGLYFQTSANLIVL